MTGRRWGILGFALSWVSTVPALVVSVIAWRRHPEARAWAVVGAVSSVVQLLTLAYMVRLATAFAAESIPVGEQVLDMAVPVLLGWGSFAVVLLFTA